MKITEENARGLEIMSLNFKALRQAKGWSIKELSTIFGISTKILTDIENGQDFDSRYLFDLCRIYQVKPHEIFSPIYLQE